MDIGLCPEEGSCGLIVSFDESVDVGDEFFDAGERGAVERLRGEDREPDFDLIEPASVGWREMKTNNFWNRRRSSDSNFTLDAFQSPAERFGMADHRNSDSADVHVILEHTDPAHKIARYYVLSVEATLFARNTFVRRWGGSARPRGSVCNSFDSRGTTGLALETWLARKAQARIQVEIRGVDSPCIFCDRPQASKAGAPRHSVEAADWIVPCPHP